ncbi:IclR family transcriptional regulator [Paraburkholderia sp. MMS20-SJTR3]|uniref:IclR family transcriptional regulator n=1 Tax=Paraburkholderia sejongensis TaxID=2886946 RepID=A0ABS8K5C0_9BURK|nr:IclR family transcriptional regulator [Paraburkholderia sp. MMS20-SJTR3]MCC8397355.1 IclR family transcriptional regulator [Paraburkholderia sp. MMS20-SJTR3]
MPHTIRGPQPANSSPEESTLFVQSLATGITVLNAFDPENRALNLPEIAAIAGISKSATQRFAFTLEALGLLEKDPATKRYSLSSRTLEIGCKYLESHPLLSRANPFLLELNRTSGETVNLAEPSGTDMIYIGRFPSLMRLLVHMPVGRRIPIYCSSAGRAYLSALDEEQAHQYLVACERVKYTPNTITDINALMEELRLSRERGFAYCNEEYFRGDLALAVPIFDSGHRVVAALQLSVLAGKWTLKRALTRFIPMMQETAERISTSSPTPQALAPFTNIPGRKV